MKRNRIILAVCILSGVLLASCMYYGWPDFPKTRFCAYLPYSDGEKVLFGNQNNDTVSFTAKLYEFKHERWSSPKHGESQGYEITHYGVSLQNDEYDIYMSVEALCYRDIFSARATLEPHNKNYSEKEFFYSERCGTASKFSTLLVDTLFLSESMYDAAAVVIVNGRGLIEYHYAGEVWRLVE